MYLKRNYTKGCVGIYMTGYAIQALEKLNHPAPEKPNMPHIHG